MITRCELQKIAGWREIPLYQYPGCRDRLIEAFGLSEMYRIARLRAFPLFEAVDRGERTTGYSAVMQLFMKVMERRMILNLSLAKTL